MSEETEPTVPLGPLDPGHDDPWYWDRFHSRVLAAAGPELARRRRLAEFTISDMVLSWGRLLVPGTLVAAAASAALLFFGVDADPELPLMDLEELLVWEAPEGGVPSALLTGEVADIEVFLVAVEGEY